MFTRLVENITVLLTEAEKLTDELDGAAATTARKAVVALCGAKSSVNRLRALMSHAASQARNSARSDAKEQCKAMNRTIKQFMDGITDFAEQIEQGAGDPAKPPILACQHVLCLSSAQSELSHARDCIRLAAAYEPDASVMDK